MEMQNHGSRLGQLVRLSQVEYETEPDQPDLLGWSVIDADGEIVGTLDDMLVDVETGDIPFGTVCYENKCTAVPLELIFMDESNQRLVLPVSKDELNEAPEFTNETENLQPAVNFWNRLVSDWIDETNASEFRTDIPHNDNNY